MLQPLTLPCCDSSHFFGLPDAEKTTLSTQWCKMLSTHILRAVRADQMSSTRLLHEHRLMIWKVNRIKAFLPFGFKKGVVTIAQEVHEEFWRHIMRRVDPSVGTFKNVGWVGVDTLFVRAWTESILDTVDARSARPFAVPGGLSRKDQEY